MDTQNIMIIIIMIAIVLCSIAVHEFAHCFMSDSLGDDTARRLGRVTLNPLKHLDPFGTIFIIFTAINGTGFGWGKPAPFNPNNFKNPRLGRMLTALAGPTSNIIVAIILTGVIQILILSGMMPTNSMVYWALQMAVLISLVLAIFNLLPISPLDGHHILGYFFPESVQKIIDSPIWMFVLFALILVPPLNAVTIQPLFRVVLPAASNFLIHIGIIL